MVLNMKPRQRTIAFARRAGGRGGRGGPSILSRRSKERGASIRRRGASSLSFRTTPLARHRSIVGRKDAAARGGRRRTIDRAVRYAFGTFSHDGMTSNCIFIRWRWERPIMSPTCGWSRGQR